MRGAVTCQPLSPACPQTDPHSSGAHAMTHDPFEELDPVVDPAFVFDFEALDEPDDASQRWSTWLSVEPLSRGPEPSPDWVVTSPGALDTEPGILKTGKDRTSVVSGKSGSVSVDRVCPGINKQK